MNEGLNIDGNNTIDDSIENAFSDLISEYFEDGNTNETLCTNLNNINTQVNQENLEENAGEIPNTVYENLAENTVSTQNTVYKNLAGNTVSTQNTVYKNVAENTVGTPNTVYKNVAENTVGTPNTVYKNVAENTVGTPNTVYKNIVENTVGAPNTIYKNIVENAGGTQNTVYKNIGVTNEKANSIYGIVGTNGEVLNKTTNGTTKANNIIETVNTVGNGGTQFKLTQGNLPAKIGFWTKVRNFFISGSKIPYSMENSTGNNEGLWSKLQNLFSFGKEK